MLTKDTENLDSFVRPRVADVRICWENLSVTVAREKRGVLEKALRRVTGRSKPDRKPVEVLKAVSGYAEGGNVVAIMGPSGAGKTTLLAALASRVKLTAGSVKINGCTVSRQIMSKIAGYVPQFDALPPSLTAMEYMAFVCALRLDKDTCAKQREILILNIFDELGLGECGDTIATRLSGGQRKRLSLATELVTSPKILFLDEPTTGLDTWTAMRVIESVKAAGRKGTIVFCSIHQPAMNLYAMFDRVVLLANGRTAFSGTLDDASAFFVKEGFACPPGFSEAEYCVRILSDSPPDEDLSFCDASVEPIASIGHSARICDAFSKSPYSVIPTSARKPSLFEVRCQTNRASWMVQLYWLLWRIYVENKRTMFDGWIEYQAYLMSFLLIGVFYAGVSSRTQTGIQDVRGALYLATSEVVFMAAYSVAYELPRELPLYLRENSIYGAGVYYVATALGLIPKILIKCLIFASVIFVSLDGRDSFISYLLFSTCVMAGTVCGTAYGTMVSGWFEDIDIASTVMVPYDLASLVMAGLFFNLRTLPSFLAFLKYSSIFYYTNEALAIVHWTRVDRIECYENVDMPCLSSGLEVLTEYGYDKSNLWLDFVGLSLIMLLMHLVGYFGVRRRRIVKSMY